MRSNRPILPTWMSFLLSVAFVLSGIAVIFFAYLTLQIILSRPNPVKAAAEDVADVGLEMNQEGPAPLVTVPLGEPTPTLIPTREPWEGSDRINILAMGIDRRPGEAFSSRTDSIMLLSIDPSDNTLSMLSIPRDLYVVIPGFGRDRINTAFVYGATGDNPTGGAALAMQTVEYNLGTRIDHYILVDFSAVTKAVDTLGGIDVNVPFIIDDPTYPDMNYGYDPLYLPSGLQHMDGSTALKYARTRHVDNDFGRAWRQQQVLMAMRDKALGLGISGLLSRAPELYQRIEHGVRTDLTLDSLIQLGLVAADISSDDINQAVLDHEYVSPHLTEKGAQVLILDNDKATPLIRQLFYGE